MKVRKILAVILTLFMLMSLVPVSFALAADFVAQEPFKVAGGGTAGTDFQYDDAAKTQTILTDTPLTVTAEGVGSIWRPVCALCLR